MYVGGLEGQWVGSYRLGKKLGAGGFGAVYRAALEIQGKKIREAAVKVLNPHEMKRRRNPFVELELELDHSNVLRLLPGGMGEAAVTDRDGESGKVVWFAMELAEESLEHRLYPRGRGEPGVALAAEDLLGLARDMAAALDYLHGRSLMHRDVKPGNILWVGGAWKLGDFGIARAASGAGSTLGSGTENYVPDEALERPRYPHPGWDVWALGVTLVEAATGGHPADALEPEEWEQIRSGAKPFVLPSLPGLLGPAVAGALIVPIDGEGGSKVRWTSKQFAAALQRDLDSTPGELNRGAFELPQETTQTADAMRRVIGDQIKALKELAAVVAPDGFDIAEPEPTPSPAPTAQIGAVARREPPPPIVILPLAPERAPEPPAEAATPAPVEPLRAPQRPVAPGPGSASVANARPQSGWLSNLLAAASRDVDEPRPPLNPRRRPNEGLDSITSDIARLVDSAAAGEIWERWRQGDTGAVSRRLYTAAGQQAFEDIRRRLRAEPAFRDSVNRYVSEFERLLVKIGQNDRDGASSRAAMLSDSGKVYMLLAHASGRLG